jgi:ketosteroid isomerase-like protein
VALPENPSEFIAAAERGINQRDLDATAEVYAADALMEAITDGAVERFVGAEEIRAGWEGYLQAMDQRGFSLRKQIRTVDGDTIVNEWTGTLGGRTKAIGIEHWTFDDDGKVRLHRMYSFLNIKPSTSSLQRARLFFTYPLSSIAFLRSRAPQQPASPASSSSPRWRRRKPPEERR